MPRVDPASIIKTGPRDINKVAITFDDGPDDVFTPQVLDVLREYKVPATFFVTGENSKRYPGNLRQILDAGHVLGNHSWDHPNLPKFDLAKMFNQLGTTNMTVYALTGKRMRLFRPPYGAINEEELTASYSTGYYVVNWDVDTADWKEDLTSQQIVDRVKAGIRPGSIILMHCARWITEQEARVPGILQDRLMAIRGIIEYIQNDKGYAFVTLDELLGLPAYFNDAISCVPEEVGRYHIVQAGETLGLIAKKYGTTWQAIAEKNNLPNPDIISQGQKLIIP